MKLQILKTTLYFSSAFFRTFLQLYIKIIQYLLAHNNQSKSIWENKSKKGNVFLFKFANVFLMFANVFLTFIFIKYASACFFKTLKFQCSLYRKYGANRTNQRNNPSEHCEILVSGTGRSCQVQVHDWRLRFSCQFQLLQTNK